MELQPHTINKPRRIFYTDLLRLIAIFAVMLLHCASYFVEKAPIHSVQFLTAHIFDTLARIGVPLFVMVSGVFMLNEDKDLTIKKAVFKYAKTTLLLYLAWSVLYSVGDNVIIPSLLKHAPLSPHVLENLIVGILKPPHLLWYLLLISGLYLITPILRQFIKKDNLKIVRYFLLLSILFQFLLPTVFYFFSKLTGVNITNILTDLHIDFVLGYTTYFILGWYIHNIGLKEIKDNYIYILGILGILSMFFGVYVFSGAVGPKDITLYNNLYLPTFLYSVSVFVFIHNTFRTRQVSDKTSKMVSSLALLTFGAYVLHRIPLFVLQSTSLYKIGVGWCILAEFVLITAISFSGAFILSKIPFIKKLIHI